MPERVFHTVPGLRDALKRHRAPTGRPRDTLLEIYIKDDVNGWVPLTTDRSTMIRIVERTSAVYRVRRL